MLTDSGILPGNYLNRAKSQHCQQIVLGKLDRFRLLALTWSGEGIGSRCSGVEANIAFAMLDYLMDMTCQNCDRCQAR